MTAKEKAIELVNRFWELDMLDDNGDLYWIGKENAKQSALICVDEMIREIKEIQFNEDIFMEDTVISYWNEVKQEIIKL